MGNMLFEEGEIVLPGDSVARGMDMLPSKGTYREGEDLISKSIGVLKVKENIINVIPLFGPYLPRNGDQVIGRIVEVGHSNWSVDIGTAYTAVLMVKEGVSEYVDLERVSLSKYYKKGDVIAARILNKGDPTFIKLTMRGPGLRKLNNGKIAQVTPSKIPRVIGKEGSMVNMIKNKTNTNIVAGQNGWIWINGEPLDEIKAAKAINVIEKEAHTHGLTDKVEKFLGEEKWVMIKDLMEESLMKQDQ